jgi:hypothetical protein
MAKGLVCARFCLFFSVFACVGLVKVNRLLLLLL